MKFSIALVATALATVAVAQDLSGIPDCAIPCIDAATTSATSCSAKDFACSCTPANMKLITAAATACVFDKCDAADAVKTLSGTKALCDSLPAEGATSAAATSAAPATTAAAESSAAPVESSSAVVESSAAPVESSSAAPVESSSAAPVESSSAAVESSAAPTAAPSSVVAVPTAPPSNGTTAAPTPTGSKGPEFTGAAAKLGAGLASVAAFALAALAL